MDWKQEVMKQLMPLAVSTLAAFASLALYALRNWANEKAKDSKLARFAAVLPEMAEAVYADVYAAVKDEIAADAARGAFSAQDLQKIRDDALTALKASLPKHGLDALKEEVGPLMDGILGKVLAAAEAKLAATPASAPPSAPAAAAPASQGSASASPQ